jgi:HK97 family phage prohead protease
MALPLAAVGTGATKRFDSEFYVEGFATTFDAPYVLYEYDGVKVYEVIDRSALVGADMSDVIMQYNHGGAVFARNKMAKGKAPSLLLEQQNGGLFVASDLGLTEEARAMYDAIEKGLIYKMSWAFRVAEDAFDKETRTRRILRIAKVFDVSPVSYPANAETDISARSYFNGVIEVEKREALARQRQLLLLKIKTEV